MSFTISKAIALPGTGPQSNVSWIPQDQLNQMAHFDGACDCNCNGIMYAQSEWPWAYVNGNSSNDAPTPGSALPATPNQNLTISMTDETFLCHWALNGTPTFSGNAGSPADSTVDTPPFGQSWEPIAAGQWPGGTCFPQPPYPAPGSCQFLSNQSKFQNGSVTVTATNLSTGAVTTTGGISPANSLETTNYSNQSRYWQPNVDSSFNYVTPSAAGIYRISITLPVYGANWFHEGFLDANNNWYYRDLFNCIGVGNGAYFDPSTGNNVDPNQYNAGNIRADCVGQPATFNIYINVIHLTCSSFNATVTPSQAETGQQFTATVSAPNGQFMPNNSDGSMQVSIDGGKWIPTTYNGFTNTWSTNISNANNNIARMGQNNIAWQFVSTNGLINSFNGSLCFPLSQFLVVAKPYIRAIGGDVLAGSDSADIRSCFDNTAGIQSFNNGSATNNVGAGTDLADLATGSIDQITSGQNLLGAIYNSLDPLSFANNTGSSYGGSFGNTTCPASDYYLTVSALQQISTANQYIGPCSTFGNTITTKVLKKGDKFICWSDGADVNIVGNITYDLTGADASDMPVFEVVVRGANINIQSNGVSNVNKLAGLYMAELYKGNGGNIYDTDFHKIWMAQTGANVKNTTSDQLVIDGAFVANKIDFYRTNGSLSDNLPATAGPGPSRDALGATDQYDAEEFNYSPINWLQTGTSTNSLTINSITSLPPVY